MDADHDHAHQRCGNSALEHDVASLMKRLPLLPILLLAACASASPSGASETTLEAALRDAASRRVSIENAESAVGANAILLSAREEDRLRLTMVNLTPDAQATDCAEAGDLSAYAGAGYWARGSEDEHGNPRVIGLRWQASGEVEVFCAAVLAP